MHIFENPDPAHCSICKRLLDVAGDPLSLGCGGDCLGCIVEAEDGEPAPSLPPDRLRSWIELRMAVSGQIMDAILPEDGTDPRDDPDAKRSMVDACCRRFQAQGAERQEAWLLARQLVERVMRHPDERTLD